MSAALQAFRVHCFQDGGQNRTSESLVPVRIVLPPQYLSRSNVSTKRRVICNWIFTDRCEGNFFLNRIQFQMPQRLLITTWSRFHVTFAVHFSQAGQGSLTESLWQDINQRRNELPRFAFFREKRSTNGASWSVRNTRVLLHIGS